LELLSASEGSVAALMLGALMLGILSVKIKEQRQNTASTGGFLHFLLTFSHVHLFNDITSGLLANAAPALLAYLT
jgi:hypothetical protein